MKKFILSVFALVLLLVSSFAENKSQSAYSHIKNQKSSETNEQILSPTLDGFLRQAIGDFVTNLEYAELKRQSPYAREVYLNFDFSNITINAKTAKLRIFCESFDKYSEPNISVYCLHGYQTSGLTWATRPTLPVANATVSVNSVEYSNAWLEWDLTPFLSEALSSQSKQATFVVAISSAYIGNDALLKLAMSESASNRPNILVTDEEPNNGGGNNSTIKTPTIFSSNMVIQRDKPIKIWGEVLPNEPVAITFDGTQYHTNCDANGRFNILLPAKSASENSYTMTIAANNESLSYTNIVMGDVYLCGGQSNMAMKISSAKIDQQDNAKTDSNYPNLRFFEVAKIVSGGILINAKDNPWKSAIPERVVDWSAVAFFVGRDLHKYLNIPIGLINVSHGGAPSDAFISPETYASNPLLDAAKRPDGTGIYQYYTTPSSLYNGMISKVAGYPIKGVLWYQAEANAGYWQNYKTIFKGLIKDWRTKWNELALPWIFVQLPAFETSTNWAETRDIQLQVWQEDPNTGMAVTIDCGEASDIHPKDKYTVAKRLLPYVKALVYGEQIVHKSPIYKSHEVIGSDIIVSFDNLGSGLTAVKEITEFEIAAADKVYKAATAIILSDNRIKLSNATVSNPENVRYAFKNNTTISIFTSDELPLPLSPFRIETSSPIEPPLGLSEIPFEKIDNAYASSTYTGRLPLYAINGAGLIGDSHEADITGKVWYTDDKPFPHYFKIELKTPQEVTALRIWNLNWTSTYLNRGVKEIEIYVSESTEAIQEESFLQPLWEKVMNHTMSQATGNNTYKGELLSFPTIKKRVKWVGINLLNSYNSANGYTGISEIKLYSPNTSSIIENISQKIFVDFYVSGTDLHIKTNEKKAILYNLYTSYGAQVSSGVINNSTQTISLTGLPLGLYIINFNNGKYNQRAKILI